MGWMFMSSPNSYAGILSPTVMEFEGGDFGRWLDHEGGTLMHRVSALIEQTLERPLISPTM